MTIPIGTWLIYRFSVEGSYLQDASRPASESCDTQQYWITPTEAFDVRTFAVDKDLRVLKLDYVGRVSEPEAYFHSVAKRLYGDIIVAHFTIRVSEETPLDDVCSQIARLNLHPRVEWKSDGFPLWMPDEGEYHTQSTAAT